MPLGEHDPCLGHLLGAQAGQFLRLPVEEEWPEAGGR